MSRSGFLYSLFFGVFFCFFSLAIAFIPLYLKDLGFSDFQIAVIASSENLATVLGPLMLTLITYHFLSARKLVLVCAGGYLLFFIPMFWLTGFLSILGVWFLCLCLNRGLLNLVNASAVKASEEQSLKYGQMRLWGSLGFVIATLVLGYLVDEIGLEVVLPSGLLMVIATCAVTYMVRTVLDAEKIGKQGEQSARAFRIVPKVMLSPVSVLFLVAALQWASHGVFYTYFSLHLQSLGWSAKMISLPWVVGVVAEIVMFMFFHRVEKRVSMMSVLRFSVLLTGVRWVILGSTSATWLIVASSVFHSVSYASFHISSLKLVFRMFPSQHKILGQALLMAAGGGFGCFIGRLVAGAGAEVLASSTGYHKLFMYSAVLSMCAWLVSLYLGRLIKGEELDSANEKGKEE